MPDPRVPDLGANRAVGDQANGYPTIDFLKKETITRSLGEDLSIMLP